MKSYKELGIEAKNRRRAKPSGTIHNKPAKKVKRIRIQHRYVGSNEGGPFFYSPDWFNKEWQNWYTKYPNIKAAEQAVKTMNRKDTGNWEYRIKPNENTKT